MIRLREAAAVVAIGMFAAGPALAQQGGSTSNDNPSATSGMQSQSRMSGSGLRHVQRELKSQGLYEGRVDGRYGPETRNALEQFQRSHNLPANGQPDQQTLAALQGGQNTGGAAAGGAMSGNGGAGMSSTGTSGTESGQNSNSATMGTQTGTPPTSANMGGSGTGAAPTGAPQAGAGGSGSGAGGSGAGGSGSGAGH